MVRKAFLVRQKTPGETKGLKSRENFENVVLNGEDNYKWEQFTENSVLFHHWETEKSRLVISERKCFVQTQLLDCEAGISVLKSASANQEARVQVLVRMGFSGLRRL